MKRLVAIALVAGLALPATAVASSTRRSTALSINHRHHTIELVGRSHRVHEYRYRGRLGTLPAGTRVTFRRSGSTLSAIRALPEHGARTVSYYARVVRAGAHALRVRLGDARIVSLSAARLVHRSRAHGSTGRAVRAVATAPPAVTVNILGLPPGITVLVTQTTDPQGHTTVSVTLPPSLGTQQVSGTITDVESDTFTVQTADGSQLVLHLAEATLDDLALDECDAVTVSYHQDSDLLIADAVHDEGPTSTGACTAANAAHDVTGFISQTSPDRLTIATASGPMTFSVDPSEQLTEGFSAGDEVDVTYTATGAGALAAIDVEYVEQDAAGDVIAVSASAVTIAVAGADASQTVTADPADAMFAGVAVGDTLDVTYHVSSGVAVADTVVDEGPSLGQ